MGVSRSIKMDCASPSEARTENITLPPFEIKGRGTPTTGTLPVTIPTLMATYKNILKAAPNINKRPN